MSTATRSNSFSRKAFKNSIIDKHKSEGDVLHQASAKKPPPPPPRRSETTAGTTEPDQGPPKSAAVKRMSRALASRKHSMSMQEVLESPTPESVPETLPAAPVTGKPEAAHRSSLLSGKDRSALRARNVSFVEEDIAPAETVPDKPPSNPSDGRAFVAPNAKPKSPAPRAGGAHHTSEAPLSAPTHKNKSISVALKSRRYSTNLVNPNNDSPRMVSPRGGSPNVYRSGEFKSFDFSLAPDDSPRHNDSPAAERSGSLSIVLPDGTKKSSFVSRLFGYVEGEELKRNLRASRAGGASPSPISTSLQTNSKDKDDEELLNMQSKIMNSDLYKLIIAENEKRKSNKSESPPEIDYTELETASDGNAAKGEDTDQGATTAAEDEEEDYMKLIASLNMDMDDAPVQKEVWEVKYNNVGFNVLIGGVVQNDGIKAAAKLIKKAKQAVLERDHEVGKGAPDPTANASPKKKKKKKNFTDKDGKKKKRKDRDAHDKRAPELRRMSSVADNLIKSLVPLRIGMHRADSGGSEWDEPPPPPPNSNLEYDESGNAAQPSMLSSAYNAGFRKASLADQKFHSANIHEMEAKLQTLSDSSDFYSDSDDSTEISLTLSQKCRKAQLDHVHKMKRDIWGRAAIGIESNFSTNPKILVMKEVAYEKGVRLLEAEFGEYRDKDKKWEGLQRRPNNRR